MVSEPEPFRNPGPTRRLRPGQVAAVSHGCPSALFKGVNILNTTQEAGR